MSETPNKKGKRLPAKLGIGLAALTVLAALGLYVLTCAGVYFIWVEDTYQSEGPLKIAGIDASILVGPTVIKWDRVLGVPVKSRNAPHGIVLWLFDYERKATRFLLHSATLTNENRQTMPLVFRRTGEWTEFIPPDRWRSHNLGHTYIEEKLDLHIYGERLTLVLDLSVEVDGRVERKKLQFDLRSLKKRSFVFNLPGA